MELNKEGRDKWKYENIYKKKGVLTKNSAAGEIEGTFEEFEKKNLSKKWEKYGHSFEGKNHLKKILSLKPKSVIDIGCGGNQFCSHLKKRKRYFFSEKKFVGVDIASPFADIIAPAHNMPSIKDKEFDLLTSFDCIEHIPEEEISAAFKEFARVSQRIFLQICLEDSPTKIDGKRLHVCIKSEDWWQKIAEKFFYIKEFDVYGDAAFEEKSNRVIYKKEDSKVRELIIVGDCKNL